MLSAMVATRIESTSFTARCRCTVDVLQDHRPLTRDGLEHDRTFLGQHDHGREALTIELGHQRQALRAQDLGAVSIRSRVLWSVPSVPRFGRLAYFERREV
jgi:hypothetical protein